MVKKKIVNGKIVEIEETNTPPPRTPDSDSSRFFTQQGGSSATMQQVPSAPRPQGAEGGNFTDALFRETNVLGQEIKVWHGILAIAAIVYLCGPVGFLIAGGVYYFSQQQQQQQQGFPPQANRGFQPNQQTRGQPAPAGFSGTARTVGSLSDVRNDNM